MDHRLVHPLLMKQIAIPVSEAKAQLTELVRRAQAGEHVVLTRHGQDAVRLVPVGVSAEVRARRLAAIRDAQAAVRGHLPPDFDAARSQDFLYGDDGLPA
jgi:prevent-host-death family protein